MLNNDYFSTKDTSTVQNIKRKLFPTHYIFVSGFLKFDNYKIKLKKKEKKKIQYTIRRITTQNNNRLYQNVMCIIDTTYDSNIKKKNKHERIIT